MEGPWKAPVGGQEAPPRRAAGGPLECPDTKDDFQVTFEVTWVDPRLELQNLQHNDNLNILAREERDSVWFPNIIFGNTDAVERMVMDDKATLIVRKEGSGTPSSLKNEIKSEIFKGEENPFFYSRTYSIKFECDFQLQSYPFDTQECTMELEVPTSLR